MSESGIDGQQRPQSVTRCLRLMAVRAAIPERDTAETERSLVDDQAFRVHRSLNRPASRYRNLVESTNVGDREYIGLIPQV